MSLEFWGRNVTLSDYVELNPRVTLLRGANVPFVSMDIISPGTRKVYPVQERPASGSGSKFGPGDTLFARITPCLENGKIAQYAGDRAGMGSSEFFVLRAREGISDPAFVYYFSQNADLRSAAEKSMSGASGRQRAVISSLSDFECKFPPLAIQERIASILSAYDELIENSQQRIKILEAMARGLYREWFVHFRFPGHDHPAAPVGTAEGGPEGVSVRQVANQNHPRVASTLGEIPKGWEVKKLVTVAEVNRAQINARSAPDELHYIDISSVSPGQIDSTTTYTFADAPGRARRIIQHGDVLWSCVRPNRRSHAQVMHPEPNTIASTGFAVLTATKVPFTFLYFVTTTDDFVAFLANNATGAAYPAVSGSTFAKADLLIPTASLLKKFSAATIPMAEQIHTLQTKIQNLRRTRDLLLPRLVSGQINVEAS